MCSLTSSPAPALNAPNDSRPDLQITADLAKLAAYGTDVERSHRLETVGVADWRANSRELFYLDAAGAMTAVPIDLTAISPAGLPTTLFPAAAVSENNMYAVTKDGQRFLVNRSQSSGTATPLTVIVNWISTLQK